jgi:hypothetical protein
VLELAPLNWKQTSADKETQRLLNDNVCRGITQLEGL